MGFVDKMRRLFAKESLKDEGTDRTVENERQLFREEMIDLFQIDDGVGEAHRDEDDDLLFGVEVDGQEHLVNLANLYAQLEEIEDEDEREAVMARFVQGTLTAGRSNISSLSWEEAREILVPVLRPSQNFAAFPVEHRPPSRTFDRCVEEVLAIDSQDTIQMVGASRLVDWGVSLPEALFAAAQNFASFSGVGDMVEVEGTPFRLFSVARDDDYQSSRLLIDGFLKAFRDRVKGRPIAIIPERATCLVSGEDEPGALEFLVEHARSTYTEAVRPLSPMVYVLGDDDCIVPLSVPPDHPQAGALSLNRVQQLAIEYESQREPLIARLDDAGQDVFVAKYIAYVREGEPLTFCSWGENVDSLLPLTGEIAFAGGSEEEGWTFRVPFSVVQEICSDCLELAPDLEPPRYRTLKFPSEEQLEALRARQVE